MRRNETVCGVGWAGVKGITPLRYEFTYWLFMTYRKRLSLLTFQIMPHVKPFCETMEEFVAVHKVQLLSSSIPEHLWESLYLKLKLEVLSNRTARKSSSGVPQWGGQCWVGCRERCPLPIRSGVWEGARIVKFSYWTGLFWRILSEPVCSCLGVTTISRQALWNGLTALGNTEKLPRTRWD